jgi:phosphoribosylanthranilate isomerase
LNEVDLSQVHALDVNSKFEVKPGLKNIEKLERLKDFIIYNLGDRAS